MSVIHINRLGRRYYLHTGPKKGGGIQHFFSMKPEGALADTIPEGYEIHENVNAGVFLRRKCNQMILEEEVEDIRQRLLKLKITKCYRAEARAKRLTIHEGESSSESIGWMKEIFPSFKPAQSGKTTDAFTSYQPVMRFVLVDAKRRIFAPERYCFRGSVDDWIPIGPPDKLSKLATKYLKHLGKESFYELF